MERIGRWLILISILALLGSVCWADRDKMDQSLRRKAESGNPDEIVPVIIQTDAEPNQEHVTAIEKAGGKVRQKFAIIKAVAADVPVKALDTLAQNPRITRLSYDAGVRPQKRTEYGEPAQD